MKDSDYTAEELEEMDNTPHYRCGNCKYFNHKPGCQRRIDHKKVKFAKPWFKSYDGNQFTGIPCCDFEPSETQVWGLRQWKGWEDYWPKYVKYWLPYENTNVTTSFTLFDDESVRYNVPLMDFVNGTMITGNRLKAISKTYYKRTRSGFGYKLVTEPINGVAIRRPRNSEKRANVVHAHRRMIDK